VSERCVDFSGFLNKLLRQQCADAPADVVADIHGVIVRQPRGDNPTVHAKGRQGAL
jgi:hypothetical protein